jgi:predicted SnoaL-like aldol condensation-catalyzing enzyme
MNNKNTEIVQEYIAQVINSKRFERIYDYLSEQCLFHNPPYVGLGIFADSSSGERMEIKSVVPNGPADGKIRAGDILLRARHGNKTWEGYEQLQNRSWGWGKIGDEVVITLLREGEPLEVTVTRGQITGYAQVLADTYDAWVHYMKVELPDLRSEVNLILASGDLVAYYATHWSTHPKYQQSAVWTSCNILRLENNKIVEWWSVDDSLSQQLQLGFRMVEPE